MYKSKNLDIDFKYLHSLWLHSRIFDKQKYQNMLFLFLSLVIKEKKRKVCHPQEIEIHTVGTAAQHSARVVSDSSPEISANGRASTYGKWNQQQPPSNHPLKIWYVGRYFFFAIWSANQINCKTPRNPAILVVKSPILVQIYQLHEPQGHHLRWQNVPSNLHRLYIIQVRTPPFQVAMKLPWRRNSENFAYLHRPSNLLVKHPISIWSDP